LIRRILKKHAPQSPEADVRHPVDRLTDEEFLDYIYMRYLGRKPDPAGRDHQFKFLREGNSRAALLVNITDAPEFVFKIVKDHIHPSFQHTYVQLPFIRDERKDRYTVLADSAGLESDFFIAGSEEDFDWLERKIIGNGYYERPGVWGLLIDGDKRMMADIAAEFAPGAVLDFGCANGAVLKCLKDKGIDGEGVEISAASLDKAYPEIMDRIRLGDIRNLAFSRTYDLILGLDIFEHLNPNKLSEYLSRLHGLLKDGGYLYANIPAFGKDSVFGEIFRIDYVSWTEDASEKRYFRAVPVDGYGYPKNGHLIGAATDWWVDRFSEAGFRRETDIEAALHRKFDEAMEKISPARRAYYVFSKNADLGKTRSILDRLASSE
jgi:2-polyprenyl-3-methyl-5-hydroxy-6-metoxy-1,4-benzoquinol methylase